MEIPTSQAEAIRCGSQKYRTGKPCKHGHVGDRWTLTANCCECTVDRVNRRRAAFRLAAEANAARNADEPI